MTTAEPPEPLTVQHTEIILFKQILQQIVGPAARHSVCSVLLSFIFLFFEKDFLQGIELPHDDVPASRSDDNRRADGGLLDLQQSIMSRPLKTFSTSADVCEALIVLSV